MDKMEKQCQMMGDGRREKRQAFFQTFSLHEHLPCNGRRAIQNTATSANFTNLYQTRGHTHTYTPTHMCAQTSLLLKPI